MKVFIWNNPYEVTFGASYLFAVAEDEDAARRIAASAAIDSFGFGPDGPEDVLGDTAARLGSPTSVHDVPFARVYEWRE